MEMYLVRTQLDPDQDKLNLKTRGANISAVWWKVEGKNGCLTCPVL